MHYMAGVLESKVENNLVHADQFDLHSTGVVCLVTQDTTLRGQERGTHSNEDGVDLHADL